MNKMFLVLAASAISNSVSAAGHVGPIVAPKALQALPMEVVLPIPAVTLPLPGLGAAKPPQSKTIGVPDLFGIYFSDHNGGTGKLDPVTVSGIVTLPVP